MHRLYTVLRNVNIIYTSDWIAVVVATMILARLECYIKVRLEYRLPGS